MKQKYGLIGFPLGHSYSKTYFTEKFAKEAIDAEYELYPLPDIRNLDQLLKDEPFLRGLNVTIPYKKSVFEFLQILSPEARAIGAVNTIGIQREGEKTMLKGWNTDAPAFESEILDFTENFIGNALVLGNGGAASAALFVLKKLGWKVTRVVRRHSDESENAILYARISKETLDNIDLIVNATPVGMYPDIDSIPEIPLEFITSRHSIFDMVYNPEVTRLMEAGIQKGAKTRNGMGMLFKQAEMAWKIWQSNDGQAKK
jgi:shikimate dehydrogenase